MAEITPVTLLTGFLGAGKTTLLNRLLRDRRLARSAVLVNEFGEAGIDHFLVEKIDNTTVLLNAGCICCSVRGDLVRALRTMLPRARRDEITHVLIETSGLADPVPVLTTLMRDPAISASYRLNGVITVVDAVNGPANLDAYPEARRQVAVADRIAVSKTDLADPAPLLSRLRSLNPAAPLIEVQGDSTDLTGLLDVGSFAASGRNNKFARWQEADDSHDHDAGFDSVCLSWDEPLDWSALSAALARLTGAHGDSLLRIKGILWLQGEAKPFALHAAGHLVHPPTPLQRWPDDADQRSRLVFVTAGVPRSVILDSLSLVGPMAAQSAGAI
jgi:G3E family GTPase